MIKELFSEIVTLVIHPNMYCNIHTSTHTQEAGGSSKEHKPVPTDTWFTYLTLINCKQK